MVPKPLKAWTDDEVLVLRRVYGSRDDEWVAEYMGRTPADIAAKADELAIRKNKRKFQGSPMPNWSDVDVIKLRVLYPMAPNIEIARLLDRSARSVASKASLLGLKKSPARLKKMGQEVVRLRRRNKPRSPF